MFLSWRVVIHLRIIVFNTPFGMTFFLSLVINYQKILNNVTTQQNRMDLYNCISNVKNKTKTIDKETNPSTYSSHVEYVETIAFDKNVKNIIVFLLYNTIRSYNNTTQRIRL